MAQARLCVYDQSCSGCPWIDLDPEVQKQKKISHFKSVWKDSFQTDFDLNIHWLSLESYHYRDRADMTYCQLSDDIRFGLYHKNKKEILDIENCAIQSNKLSAWFKDFREMQFPIDFGSFRLRVGPDGQRGVWLDFSNLAVKNLFEEKHQLLKLMKMAHVEIGQRKKVLKLKANKLSLGDPEPHPWFQTYYGDDLKEFNLDCSVGDFTQPSMAANKVLIKEYQSFLKDIPKSLAIEVGAGVGNLSIPTAYIFDKLYAFELDKNAVQHLNHNLVKAQLQDKVQATAGDIFRSFNYDLPKADLLVLDPPRSGFHRFLSELFTKSTLPDCICYISCFAESFSKDSLLMRDHYKLERFSVLDQFPHSPHYEVLSLWTLK